MRKPDLHPVAGDNHIGMQGKLLICLSLLSLLAIAALEKGLVIPSKARAASGASAGRRADTPAHTLLDPNNASASMVTEARRDYGILPLGFEVNQGQTDSAVKFLTRAQGHELFLTSIGAVITLAGPETTRTHRSLRESNQEPESHPAPRSSLLYMRFKGARPSTPIGTDELPGKTNYFIGNRPEKWIANVRTYARVLYRSIYEGVDLVFYGNQRQLEYDFTIQPDADLKDIRLVFDGAQKLSLKKTGDLMIRTKAGTMTLLKPVAHQEAEGRKQEIPSRYLLTGKNEVAFSVGHYDKDLPLVIDPVLAYSTYLGGTTDDFGYGIAVDSAGSAYITGQTSSPEFPIANALQPTKGSSADVFVTKLNPAGTGIVYSTFLGGTGFESGYGIAVDNGGNAYVTGLTTSSDFPLANALHSTLGGVTDAFVAELNNSGSALVYSTYLGGSSFDSGYSIAVDQAGNAYVTGEADSRDFPTTNPLQAAKSGNAIFKSTNAAASWSASESGFVASTATSISLDPANSAIVYAAADNGIFKSTNGGSSWIPIGLHQTGTPVNKVVVDPTNPAILYAATNSGIYKSTDGGDHFNAINNGFNPTFARNIFIDPLNPANLYATTLGNSVYRTINGGSNWTPSFINGVSSINAIAIDPNSPATIYAGTSNGVYKSINGAVTWAPANLGIQFEFVRSIGVDRNNSSLLYAGSGSGIFKSTNAGNNWTNINGNLGSPFVSVLSLDPNNSSTIYIATSTIFKTIDGGATWNPASNGYSGSTVSSLVVDPSNPSTLFIGTLSGSEMFAAKLSAGGTTQLYSTYLGGVRNDVANGIAVDGAGNAYITGSTTSSDFPTANAFQPATGLGTDAVVVKINNSGSALVYSTYLGGNGTDVGWGIAVDSSGSAYVTGATSSSNFPTANAVQPASGSQFASDAFITKLNPSGSGLVYSSYLGGNSDDRGFAIALDFLGNAYITGITSSQDFPQVNPLTNGKAGGFSTEAFVTKVDAAGAALVYSSFLGGGAFDEGTSIAVDSAGATYVTGNTDSLDFPTVNSLQSVNKGSADVFVAKISLAPDVSITMTDSPDPTALGNNFTYAISVSNSQESPANGVTVSDHLPAGVNFVSASPSQGSCAGTTNVACNLGALAKGATATISIVVSPTATGQITNTATVSSQEPDSNPANNSATATTMVTALPSISGRVVDLNANGFVAVTVSLTGSQSKTTQTDDNGNYAFNDLPAAGNYAVTASKANYQFTPPTQAFNNLQQHQKANFSSLCSYAISPLNQSFSAAGGTGTVTLSESGSCAWSAVSNVPWAMITSGASGSGSATLSFSVAAATAGSRRGTLTIAGQTFTIWQGVDSCTACDFTVARNFTAGGSPGPFVVADFNNDGKFDLVTLNSNVPPQQSGGGSDEGISVMLGDGKGGFGLPSFVARVSAYQVQGIATGDFNGDGRADLAVPVWAPSGTVNIYLGDGNGGFGPPISEAVGSHPNNVAVGDVNGDGKADLVVTNEESHSVSILLGDGAGGFGPAMNFGSFGNLAYPRFVAIADLNGDGKPDLAVANIGSVGILLGDGTGSFTFTSSINFGGSPQSLAITDLNGDGKPDLVVANGGVSIAFGNGNGTFGTPIPIGVPGIITAGQGFAFVKTGDFNGDGKIDIVGGNGSSAVVSVFLNDGLGGFSKAGDFEAGNVTGLAIADFDGDGKLDVVAPNYGIPVSSQSTSFGTISLFKGLGNGKLEGAPVFSTGIQPTFVATADFNLDGKLDIAVATGADVGTGALSILLGNGNGGFLPAGNFTVAISPISITVGDFNGDGKPDLATANYNSSNISILLGDGAGGFGAATNISVGPLPRSIATGDFNGDGKLDLAVTDTTSDPRGHVSIFLGNGSGGFSAAGGFFVNGGAPYALAVGDFNLDGRADLITVNNSNTFNAPAFVSIFKGDGAGGFASQIDFANPAIGGVAFRGGFNLVVDDFNGDGKLDAAVLDTGNNKIAVLLGNGKAGFTSIQSFAVGSEPRNLAIGDFNGDGKPDLAVSNWSSNNVSVLIGDGSGNFSSPFNFNVGQYSAAVAVGDFNGDGKTDIVAANYGNANVALLLNSCPPLTSGSRVMISGHITDNTGQALARVSVIVSPAHSYSRTTQTDVNGNYLLFNLPTSDSYTVAASARYYAMNPANRTFDTPSANQTADFTATRLKHNITGRVIDFDGNGVGGVTITLGSPQGGPVITTDGNGNFGFPALDAGFNYYVTPSKSGYSFDPLSYNFYPLESDGTAMFTISPDQIKFDNSLYSGSEGAGAISIPVTRSGDVSGAAAVDFATSDGTARQSRDYTAAFGTLSFGPGEATKTINILVTDNAYVDANRSLTLTLSNPTRATIAGPNPVTVFINDNDSAPPTTNPLDNSDAQFFVRQHYYDFLSRLPDPSGFGFWTGQITQCGSDQTCLRNKKIDVSNAFFYELEYQQTGAYVYRLYRAAFGNSQPFPNAIPDPNHPGEEKKVVAYQAFVQDRARVVGGVDLAQSQLNLANTFVQRSEFLTKYPPALDGPGFVDAVLAKIKNDIGVDLVSQRTALINLFNSGGRGAVLYRLADDNVQTNPIDNRAFIDAEYNRAFVATQYFGYLRRDPDMAGFLFWLGQVSSAPLRDVPKQHAMVCSFITSAEYQLRFSPIVTHTNSECPQ